MTSFLHLNVQDYVFEQNVTELNKVCICCTSQNVVLIKFTSCKHTGFLANFIKTEIDIRNSYICNICHNMLKKIEAFKQQVEESTALLLDQVPILKINKLYNFQRSPMEIDGVTKSEIELEVKPELTEPGILEIETDVKVEHDSSDNETEPLAELKRKKKKKTKNELRYEGKIGVVILTETELKEERERMAKSEGYLKLPYKCEDCIVGFDHELTLVSHIEKRHKKIKNGFQCQICKSVLSTKFSYNEHTKRHIRRLECMICRKRYNHMQSAVQHYDEHHAAEGAGIQEGYTCRECGFTTTSNRSYRYHMDKHKKKQSCDICGNMFVNSNGLKVHMYTVHKQSSRVYKCEQCNKSYRSRSGLEAHQRSAHGTIDTRAFCVVCKTHYSTAQGLQHHLNTHSRHVSESDKRFICDECGAKFVTKSNLQVHINWEHFKINTHRCTKCTKIFKSRNALNRHITYVHNKKRPPRNKICDYCGRAFTTQTILQSHIRTHTGERPLHCTHCPATFAHSAALYTHNKLLHTPK
ncbi:hypothetical protein PYW08_012223 [Mythimna loreyi]|uniref:Uncharacterized protein n=1 Tax=Mythimna loreyi TaxID=667449 RepID=A0ACC2Q2C9_9NEOP|nr:hypothetical protein PYW08_012223 [Mythimna loreyi]